MFGFGIRVIPNNTPPPLPVRSAHSGLVFIDRACKSPVFFVSLQSRVNYNYRWKILTIRGLQERRR